MTYGSEKVMILIINEWTSSKHFYIFVIDQVKGKNVEDKTFPISSLSPNKRQICPPSYGQSLLLTFFVIVVWPLTINVGRHPTIQPPPSPSRPPRRGHCHDEAFISVVFCRNEFRINLFSARRHTFVIIASWIRLVEFEDDLSHFLGLSDTSTRCPANDSSLEMG